MIIRLILAVVGSICMVLGFVGLAVPLMPGFIFFAIGTICLASASPFLARQLAKQPRLGRFLQRIELSRGMALSDRIKIIFWASAEIFVDKNAHRSARIAVLGALAYDRIATTQRPLAGPASLNSKVSESSSILAAAVATSCTSWRNSNNHHCC